MVEESLHSIWACKKAMVEESLHSIWASMNSWFTPTVLFLLMNIMIGTIVVISRFGTKKQQEQQNQYQEQPQPQLARASSLLQRLKSINFYHYTPEEENPVPTITKTFQEPEEENPVPTITKTFQEPEEENPVPTVTKTFQEPETETIQTLEQNADEFSDHNITRTKSEMRPASGEIPVKLRKKMKKSASVKSAFGHFEEREIVDRGGPLTAREGKSKVSDFQLFGDDDDEVDGKADTFINKFNQQLKLQRLDSIRMYREMLTRGTNSA